MVRTLLAGLFTAIAAAVVLLIGGPLGLNGGVSLAGAALGAVLALVPYRGPFWRIGAWAVGFVITWVAYAIAALLFPANNTGAAVGAFVGLFLVTLVCALTKDRLPLWAGFVGVAGFVGAYYAEYSAAPYLFKTESILYMAAIFATTMIGFLAASLAELIDVSRPASAAEVEVIEEIPATASGE